MENIPTDEGTHTSPRTYQPTRLFIMETGNITARTSSPLPSKDTSGLDPDEITRVTASYDNAIGTVTEFEKRKTVEGEAKFRRLGWKRMTVILIVEAIGLGTFSLPAAFATLGMVAGVICCVALGLVVIYTGWIVGKVKVVYPEINHYGDIGGLVMGRFGKELVGGLYVLQLILMTASFCLTGTVAFNTLSDNGACGLVFSIVSGALLFLLSTMPSFTEAAILGYIDLASVMTTIFIALIGSGVRASSLPGGIAGQNWSAWPATDTTFKDAMVAISNIMFSYSFCMFITPFQSEMHTPTDFMKSIWTLGIVEIVVYTLIGSLIYVFIGVDVQSPSLLSLNGVLPKVAFGFALPLIFISGAIGNTVTARYVHLRLYKNSIARFINTPKGWTTWFAVLVVVTVVAWVLAESIPFFDDLLSLSSALLISGFVLYFPAVMWVVLLCEGKLYARQNVLHALACIFIFLLGILVLVGGTYASIQDILHHYDAGAFRVPFSC
ncbi:transmembrane amino acid transporter protein-domain-containing protein [Aspergillus floccosus]